MLNVHCIEGRLAESPILKKTESGTCYTRVLLISKRNFKTKRTWDKNPKSNQKTGVGNFDFLRRFYLIF
ncbi:single-stranded DNA-binding protein [Enterococcus faecium]|uniref:Single-stranded DNA-binding protein n=1 Tax=Enterococcus lactis TaxID=357441 RepID=A0AAJ1SMG0_9ENTE|nr:MULTISPECIES: single-stranded DNA-binding protein [Enterococcus]ERK34560.1 hypothetical protein I131_11345 [Enterococcus faecium CRL1879]MCB8590828.1 single-stranded DNA-binding protein [Enterococcus lactis]MCO5391269.1 single-stranded DNA-binding protein [Enterococcus faecium]MCO5430552.1 single-stranded DNA-binding protein [Enterococcus faecium]MCV3193201.1 single-stranded DNA-binding protein [Enterococcus faecium]